MAIRQRTMMGIGLITLMSVMSACNTNPPVPTVAVLPTSALVTATIPVPPDSTTTLTIATSEATLPGTPESTPATATPDATQPIVTPADPQAVTETPDATVEASPESSPEPTQDSTQESTAPNPVFTGTLPAGTLLLSQQNKPTALLPDGRLVAIPDERFDRQSAPNGTFGVRFVTIGTLIDLAVVDLSSTDLEPVTIPEGKGFYSPIVLWKTDSSGFVFYDFPPTEKVRLSRRALYYYDLAAKKATLLLRDTNSNSTLPAAISFAPDGKYLIYTLISGDSEGIGDANSPVYLLNLEDNTSQLLPNEAGSGFRTWLPNSTGFVVTTVNGESSTLTLYRLDALGSPVTLTPEGASDVNIAFAPGSDQAVISTAAADGKPSLVITRLGDSTERSPILELDVSQAPVTGLVWTEKGILYSTIGAGAADADITYQVQPDGSAVTRITDGTIRAVIGE